MHKKFSVAPPQKKRKRKKKLGKMNSIKYLYLFVPSTVVYCMDVLIVKFATLVEGDP